MKKYSYNNTIKQLRMSANPKNVEGMARFGINPQNTLGISVVDLRKIARGVGKNHVLAEQLWDSGIHEARILASMIDEPGKVTEQQIERWVKDFDSWDVCDQVCDNLFMWTKFAYPKVFEWSKRKEEFVKRAAFTLVACLSVHDKDAEDKKFIHFLVVIKDCATDERNFVRKAVNWALRNIGKRNIVLNSAAIKAAREIRDLDLKGARWIAQDAIRELMSQSVRERLRKKVTKL